MKAVALVGGQGTRLRPLTFRTPKPLLPLLNRPLLEYVLERCRRNGIDELILSTNYLPDLFRASFGDDWKGVHVEYVHEAEALGTAGGVKNCQAHLDGTFYVFNGDVLTGLDLKAMLEYHRSKEAVATIYLTPVDDPRAYGVVLLDSGGRVEEFIEKPSLDEAPTNMINGGVYVLESSVLEMIPTDQPWSFEREVFPGLVAAGEPVFGYESDAYWLDVGTPPKYLQAHVDLLEGACDTEIVGKEVAPGVWVDGEVSLGDGVHLEGPAVIGDGTRIAAGASIKGPVSIGPGCEIGPDTSVTRAALAANVRIGGGCVVEDAIFGEECVVGDDCRAAEYAVIGPGAKIAAGNELSRGMRVWPDVEVGPSSIQF